MIVYLHPHLQNNATKDLVAQLVEHLPFKERVLGSSPSQITTIFEDFHHVLLNKDLVAQLVEHLPFKERVLGSSPSQITKNSNKIHLRILF